MSVPGRKVAYLFSCSMKLYRASGIGSRDKRKLWEGKRKSKLYFPKVFAKNKLYPVIHMSNRSRESRFNIYLVKSKIENCSENHILKDIQRYTFQFSIPLICDFMKELKFISAQH